MYANVLVPTDGSAGMDQVAEHAMGIAGLCEATVHTLYVVDDTAYQTVPDDAREQVREALAGDGESATKAIAERAVASKIETRREIRWGDPAVSIIAYAVENDIDLIIMGTRGKTGFERYMLGSVAEKVVRGSPIPVLTVHIGDADELLDDIKTAIGT
jgi:nucleotide-binding universal stress UspA family protein